MFPHPWVVKTIKERVFPPLPNGGVSLFVFGSSIIAGGQCNCTEPIFWFSTSTVLEKQSGLSHSDLVYCSARSVLFRMMWSETRNNVQLCSQGKSGGSFSPSCRIIVFLCVCDWTLHLQGTSSLLRFAQQEDLVYCLITQDFLLLSPLNSFFSSRPHHSAQLYILLFFSSLYLLFIVAVYS